MTVSSINPATGETIETFDPHSDQIIDKTLTRAWNTFHDWRAMPVETRAAHLLAVADRLEQRKAFLSETMTLEMGKPLAQARAEVEKCAWVCRYYAEEGPRFITDERLASDSGRAFVRHLPIGPVLAVMPWNFPLWQVFRFAAPALLAGNVGLLKHASNVWRCALEIETLFLEAGCPEGCFQTLLIGSGKVEQVLRDKRVRGATLTGSGPAGSSVAAIAGDEIKPSLLELGGTDAFIVMPSADITHAIDTAIKARTMNNGQSCIAAKRFFVHSDVYDDFRSNFVAGFQALRVGNPMDEDIDIGPLAMEGIRDDLRDQVARSTEAGASPLCPQRDVPAKGWYMAPQILENAPESAPAFSEELFGPVASLWRVYSLDEAVRLANRSPYGLGSAIFTHDESEMETATNELEAGATFVNTMVASDPRLPFGGVKQSGYGRELYRDGIHAFMNRKTIRIA